MFKDFEVKINNYDLNFPSNKLMPMFYSTFIVQKGEDKGDKQENFFLPEIFKHFPCLPNSGHNFFSNFAMEAHFNFENRLGLAV